MTEATTSSYWISSTALYITLNANGDPNYIVGNTTAGAQILCYMRGIDGLDYDAGHNYRRWPLTCSPTFFNSNSAKYVYIAIPRPGNPYDLAMVVFPSERLDIYGKNAAGTQIGSTDYYYIWLQGIISATNAGATQNRTWTQYVNTGTLSSDEAINAGGDQTWWRYLSVDDTVHFLKEIVMDAKSIFQNLKAKLFILNGHELKGVTKDDTLETNDDTIVTPKQVIRLTKEKYLSKTDDDTAAGNITFQQDINVGGDATISGDATVGGDASISGDETVGGDVDVTGKVTAAQLIADLFKTPGFIKESGLAGLGFGVTTDANGKATVQTDDLFVLGRMFVNSLNIREVSYIGGIYLLTPAGSTVEKVIDLYSTGSYSDTRLWTTEDIGGLVVGHRVLWKADDGTTSTMNYWHQGDQAFCEIFNINEAGHYDNFHNRRYWRLVCRVGHTTIDGKEYNYADLSDQPYVYLYDNDGNEVHNEAGGTIFFGYEGAKEGENDNDIPDVDDKVVCLGSQADQRRQAAIELSAEGTGSFGIYDNINDYMALSNYEIHFMSKDAVRMRASRFSLTTENNISQPATIYCGEWSEGNISEWGYEWKYGGHNWLCIMPRDAVDPNSQNVRTGQTREAPGTTAAWWVDNKGESGKTYSLGFYTDEEDPTPIMGLAVRPASVDETVKPYLLYGQDDISASVTAWRWERESNYPALDEAWANSMHTDPEDPTSPLKSVTRTLHITNDDLPTGWDTEGGKVGFKCTATFTAGGEQAEIINRISIV